MVRIIILILMFSVRSRTLKTLKSSAPFDLMDLGYDVNTCWLFPVTSLPVLVLQDVVIGRHGSPLLTGSYLLSSSVIGWEPLWRCWEAERWNKIYLQKEMINFVEFWFADQKCVRLFLWFKNYQFLFSQENILSEIQKVKKLCPSYLKKNYIYLMLF